MGGRGRETVFAHDGMLLLLLSGVFIAPVCLVVAEKVFTFGSGIMDFLNELEWEDGSRCGF
jgi:hypothetical protein